MKTLFASLAAVAALSVAGAAAAGPLDVLKPDYVQGSVGVQKQSNRDDGTAFSVTAGRDLGAVRAEVEYATSNGAGSKTLGEVEADTVSLNLYYDLQPVRGITPFVGAGVGYADLDGAGVVGDSTGAIWNFAAGASYTVRPNLDLVAQYRYNIANDIEVRKGVGKVEKYRAGVASIGVRYTF